MKSNDYEIASPVHHLTDGIRNTSDHDGGTVLDIGGNRIFRLNLTGAFIFECMRQGWSESRIATELSNRFSVSEPTATKDVHEFVQMLDTHQLLGSPRQQEEL